LPCLLRYPSTSIQAKVGRGCRVGRPRQAGQPRGWRREGPAAAARRPGAGVRLGHRGGAAPPSPRPGGGGPKTTPPKNSCPVFGCTKERGFLVAIGKLVRLGALTADDVARLSGDDPADAVRSSWACPDPSTSLANRPCWWDPATGLWRPRLGEEVPRGSIPALERVAPPPRRAVHDVTDLEVSG
jgi:hypothetical protein